MLENDIAAQAAGREAHTPESQVTVGLLTVTVLSSLKQQSPYGPQHAAGPSALDDELELLELELELDELLDELELELLDELELELLDELELDELLELDDELELDELLELELDELLVLELELELVLELEDDEDELSQKSKHSGGPFISHPANVLGDTSGLIHPTYA